MDDKEKTDVIKQLQELQREYDNSMGLLNEIMKSVHHNPNKQAILKQDSIIILAIHQYLSKKQKLQL